MPLHLQACHGSSALLRSMLPEGTALRLNRHASAVRLHSDCCSVTAGDVSCDYDVVFLAMPAACARRIVGVYASLDTSQREALAAASEAPSVTRDAYAVTIWGALSRAAASRFEKRATREVGAPTARSGESRDVLTLRGEA